MVKRMIDDLMRGHERHATLRHRNYRKDGSVIWVEWHNSALRDETGRVISILSLAQDVSSRIQAEERLQYMATHDGLTGLPNSVLLNDRLAAALSVNLFPSIRYAVIFVDGTGSRRIAPVPVIVIAVFRCAAELRLRNASSVSAEVGVVL